MGLGNGQLSDKQLTLSSSKQAGKMSDVRFGGEHFWQPLVLDNKQFIQVDFLGPRNISGLIFASDIQVQVTEVKVEFSNDGLNWIPIGSQQVTFQTKNSTTTVKDVRVFLATLHRRVLVPVFCAGQEDNAYAPGTTFRNENCEECLCKIGGVADCRPKNCTLFACPKNNMQKFAARGEGLCECKCRECPAGERLCPTSNDCTKIDKWCDGVRDCADDELDCPTLMSITTTPNPEMTTTETPEREARCFAIGRTVKTFDGTHFKYDFCDNTMLADRKKNFSVNLKKICNTSNGTVCTRVLVLLFRHQSKRHELILHSNFTAFFNGRRFSVQQMDRILRRMKNFRMDIFKMGNSVVLLHDHDEIGEIRVVWNSQQHLRIAVTGEALNNVFGMCGSFDDNQANDYVLPGGGSALVSQVFGDSWANKATKCPDPVPCSEDLQRKSWEICKLIKESPFESCSSHLDVDQFLSHCAETACQCLQNAGGNLHKMEKCRCSAPQNFATACANVGGSEFSETVTNWRRLYDCPGQCPKGFVHFDCPPDMCQETCTNGGFVDCSDRRSYQLLADTMCFPGCYCPEGLIEKDGACVPPKTCHDMSCEVSTSGQRLIGFDRNPRDFVGNCSHVLVDSPGLQNETIVNGKLVEHGVNLRTDGVDVRYFGENLAEILLILEQVRISFAEENFAIKLSSHVFRDSTGGLCGDKNSTAFSGQALQKYLPGLQICEQEVGDESVKQCSPEAEKLAREICRGIHRPAEHDCLALESPTKYAEMCERELCKFSQESRDELMARSCAIFRQYFSRCEEFGVCVQWRSERYCPGTCSNGRTFQSCRRSCSDVCSSEEPLSKIVDLIDLRSKPTVPGTSCAATGFLEGCFCPGNQLFSVKRNKCVPEHQCNACDEFGHFPGDVWQPDACSNCTCSDVGGIECTVKQCPAAPICGRGQEVMTEAGECCDVHECKAIKILETCAELQKPVCRFGQVLKLVEGDDHACPFYACEPPKQSCIYEHKFRADAQGNVFQVADFLRETKLHPANETWFDGPCNRCKCETASSAADANPVFYPVCVQEVCEDLTELERNYQLELVKSPGKCCPEGYAYKTPSESGTDDCCGKCVKVACLDDSGNVKQPNETWLSSDGCLHYECVLNTAVGQVHTVGGRVECPFFDSQCPEADVHFSPDGCCKLCNSSSLSHANCEAVTIQDQETQKTIADPRSPKRLCKPKYHLSEWKACLGHCESAFSFPTAPVPGIFGEKEKRCSCCQPEASSSINVTWICQDGFEFRAEVKSVSTCQCLPCGY
ncbi:unnamed protein product [Notodromas monacha]|uniref:SCO-spondin n=1 Tax=Notodromas monacha TaxID=399045 RepID=A0A7R9G9D8_9CRUS|nr:unnamed protein product [Notodromas monacha]CAG0914107.1 unnamed protein product [Notodromas monacha]